MSNYQNQGGQPPVTDPNAVPTVPEEAPVMPGAPAEPTATPQQEPANGGGEQGGEDQNQGGPAPVV